METRKTIRNTIIATVAGLLLVIAATIYSSTVQKGKAEQSLIPTPTSFTPSIQPTTVPGVITVIPADITTPTFKNFTASNSGYPAFSIQYLSTWQLKNEVRNSTSTISLTKGDYELRIYQATIGGGWCIFQGTLPEGMYIDLRNKPYTQVLSGIGTLRRYKTESEFSNRKDLTSFAFCHNNVKRTNQYTTYSEPTGIGSISYTVPVTYTQATILEMDSIIKTLKEVK